MVYATKCAHIDRQHSAKGLCKPCYMMEWIGKNPNSNTGKRWLKNNPDRARYHRRVNNLRSRHNISVEEYQELWIAQQEKCANPGCSGTYPLFSPDHRRADTLQVDHSHTTGVIRGLLCKGCNSALGQIKDDINRLQGLIKYLEESMN